MGCSGITRVRRGTSGDDKGALGDDSGREGEVREVFVCDKR